MRQKIKSYKFLKCSGFFFKEEHISRSDYRVLSPALLSTSNSSFNSKSAVSIKNLRLLTSITRSSLYSILPDPFLQQIKNAERTSGFPTSFSNSNKNHHYLLFQSHRNFQLINLESTALSLLKTQYFKKPKNPV